jgi:SPX domain protein involved in polyphosphate accumulation
LSQSSNWRVNDFRHELKVPFEHMQFIEFQSWLQQSGLHPKKQFPDRKVHSVYLDTAMLDDYQDNVSGMSQRGKLRLRWYNDATEKVVLELKNKRGRLANKLVIELQNPCGDIPFERRISDRLLRSTEKSREIAKQHNLFPSLHVQYERAYFEIAPGIRMTLDKRIRYQKLYPLKTQSTTASAVEVVVEFKYPISEAAKAARLLTGMPGRIFRHSKYVIGVDTVCDL